MEFFPLQIGPGLRLGKSFRGSQLRRKYPPNTVVDFGRPDPRICLRGLISTCTAALEERDPSGHKGLPRVEFTCGQSYGFSFSIEASKEPNCDTTQTGRIYAQRRKNVCTHPSVLGMEVWNENCTDQFDVHLIQLGVNGATLSTTMEFFSAHALVISELSLIDTKHSPYIG